MKGCAREGPGNGLKKYGMIMTRKGGHGMLVTKSLQRDPSSQVRWVLCQPWPAVQVKACREGELDLTSTGQMLPE